MPPTPDDSIAQLTTRYVLGRKTLSLMIELDTKTKTLSHWAKFKYVVDTGADFVLMPFQIALQHDFEGFDPRATFETRKTNMSYQLTGCFGTLSLRIGQEFTRPLDCFYYQLVIPEPKTAEEWADQMANWTPGKPQAPIILGRPILQHCNVAVQDKHFIITRRSILDPAILPFP